MEKYLNPNENFDIDNIKEEKEQDEKRKKLEKEESEKRSKMFHDAGDNMEIESDEICQK